MSDVVDAFGPDHRRGSRGQARHLPLPSALAVGFVQLYGMTARVVGDGGCVRGSADPPLGGDVSDTSQSVAAAGANMSSRVVCA